MRPNAGQCRRAQWREPSESPSPVSVLETFGFARQCRRESVTSTQSTPTELLGRVTSRCCSATANLLKLLTIIYFQYIKYIIIIIVTRQFGLSLRGRRRDSPLSNNAIQHKHDFVS